MLSITRGPLVSFLVLVISLILHYCLVDCLSLTELHSTVPSNNRYKQHLQKEKSLRDALRDYHHHQQQINGLASTAYTLPFRSQHYDPSLILPSSSQIVDESQYSLPDDLQVNYLSESPLIGMDKRQDEVVMDIPLEYTSDIPYEFYPELWPSNKHPTPARGKPASDLSSSSDIFNQMLATKIADLLEMESNQNGQSIRSGYLPSTEARKKRTLVKRNHGSDTNSKHGGRSNRAAPSLSVRPKIKSSSTKPSMPASKHKSIGEPKDHQSNKVTSRKLGETKKPKLIKVPLKSSLSAGQPVKGEITQPFGGKTVLASRMINSQINNGTKRGKESETIDTNGKQSKNLRKIETLSSPKLNLDRKEKAELMRSNPSMHQVTIKDFFNGLDVPKGPKNVVKRSVLPKTDLIGLGLRQDDDTIDGYNVNNGVSDDDMDDGDDSVDGISNNNKGDDDLLSEMSDGEYRSIGQSISPASMDIQSNPWLVDEAARTLMRSLAVKRRKRGYNTNNDDDEIKLIGLDDVDTIITKYNTDGEDANNSNSNNNYANIVKIDKNNNLNDNNGDDVKISGDDDPLSEKNELTDFLEFGEIDEVPTRIVKKGGVTLESSPVYDKDDKNDEKKADKGLTNGEQKSTFTSLDNDADGDETGANDTFFEEELTEGLISIGDLGDLDNINETGSIGDTDGNINYDKKREPEETGRSKSTFSPTGSTSPPFSLANRLIDEERIESKVLLDDSIVNGSSDRDDELLEETIGKRIYASKKKRSVTPYFGEVDGSLIAQEEAKFNNVDGKLGKIEETLLLEALDLIKNNLNGETIDVNHDVKVKHRVETRLNAAYDLEDMRLALNDLHKMMQKLSTEDEDGDIDDDNRHGNDIIINGEDRDLFSNQANDKVTISGKLDDDDDNDNSNNNKASSTIGHQSVRPSSLSTLNNFHDFKISKHHQSNALTSDDCHSIQLLTTDCSTVKDVVPNGPLQKIFGKACNWHEICYTCGELFGLMSSDCDMGFLEQSRLACNDSSSCEAASRLILMPLRSRRVFYRRKVPPMCYQQPCIESFLLKGKH